MEREQYEAKAKELIPLLKGLSVYDADRVLVQCRQEITKAGTI